MPATSPAQERLMQAAAHTPGGYGGVPQAVGKEFVGDATFVDPPEDANDHEIAEGMRDGKFSSPQKVGEFWLFDTRVTGTGVAYRDSIGEFAVRDPGLWLSEDFVKRAASVPVIFEHPPGHGLNSEEYRERSIGNMVLSYVKDDEVRGVAKIFDADAAVLMQTTHTSTSPGVIGKGEGGETIVLESGARVLAEGLPLILDHLAVCKVGVWDKGGPPDGIRLDSVKEPPMADKDEPKFDMSTADGRKDAKTWLDAFEEKERKDAAGDEPDDKKDAKKDDVEEMTDAKKDGGGEPDDKKDAKKDAEPEEKKDAKKDGEGEPKDDARKDGAAKENVDVERGTTIKDSAAHDLIANQAKTIANLQTQVDAMRKEPSAEDGVSIEKAFHRADSLFQMLGDRSPKSYPGESPIAYRRRLANLLRPHAGPKFKDYAIHDSLDATSFSVIEDSIYAAAEDTAKESKAIPGAKLREIVSHRHGKTTVRFVGDANEAWRPFQPATSNFVRSFNRTPGVAR